MNGFCRVFSLLITTFILSVATIPLKAIDFLCDPENSLMDDLLVVNFINKRLSERLPVTYNFLLQGGYFAMPSARMGAEGEIGFGISCVPPYRNYNLRIQLLDFVEISGNYRIFTNFDDPVLTPFGFGDFSDKGANVKFSIFSPEASQYKLPGVAIGFEDFLGTRAFKANYIVLTQVFLNYNLELSLGYGEHRIRGLFGGALWMPFRESCDEYLKGLAFSIEYDATPYKDKDIEKHPDGRVKKTPFNFGIKYRLWDSIDFSLAYIRGDAFACSISGYYNLGMTKGLIPKIDDSLPYRAPVNREPIGFLRPEEVLAQELACALRLQGFELLELWLSFDPCGQKILRLKVINGIHRSMHAVRERLDAVLAALVPDDIDYVIVTNEVLGLPVQEYVYNMEHLRDYAYDQIGKYELDTLTTMREATHPNIYESKLLFYRQKDRWNMELLPKTHTLFGSSKGKFKYAFGLTLAFNGFLPSDIFYSISLGYFVLSNLYDISDVDRLNPSQLINVRTDIINYYKQKSITIDQAYMQKMTNWGRGFYTRCALGYFEPEYGGAAFECLYYPVNSSWAFGLEGAILKKRELTGLGFSDKIRKLVHFHPTYQHFLGSQYFANFYYDWRCADLSFKISVGKFLANDFGVRYEVQRSFPSGLILSFWYTRTTANDIINGERYFDKGIAFSLPLDIFYTKSSRAKWGYGMSAWLRDVGVRAYTGPELYQILNEQRQ